MPATLQHQFRIQLFNTQDAGIDGPMPLLGYQEKTSQLAGKRLTLSYAPATQTCMAEAVRFELTGRLTGRRFSRPLG